MTEDKVVVGRVVGALEVALDLARESVGERHRSTRPPRLRRPVGAPRVAAAHPHESGAPVDVAPARRDEGGVFAQRGGAVSGWRL
jgi:hypothetical protein